MSKFVSSASIDESNAMRAQLGLPPLATRSAAADERTTESVSAASAAADSSLFSRRRNPKSAAVAASAAEVSLGDRFLSNGGSAADWVAKSKSKQTQSSRKESAAAQVEPAAVSISAVLTQNPLRSTDIILTLKDSSILNSSNTGENSSDDELEDAALASGPKLLKSAKANPLAASTRAKIGDRKQVLYGEEEESELLSKYSEPNEKKKRSGLRINENGEIKQNHIPTEENEENNSMTRYSLNETAESQVQQQSDFLEASTVETRKRQRDSAAAEVSASDVLNSAEFDSSGLVSRHSKRGKFRSVGAAEARENKKSENYEKAKQKAEEETKIRVQREREENSSHNQSQSRNEFAAQTSSFADLDTDADVDEFHFGLDRARRLQNAQRNAVQAQKVIQAIRMGEIISDNSTENKIETQEFRFNAAVNFARNFNAGTGPATDNGTAETENSNKIVIDDDDDDFLSDPIKIEPETSIESEMPAIKVVETTKLEIAPAINSEPAASQADAAADEESGDENPFDSGITDEPLVSDSVAAALDFARRRLYLNANQPLSSAADHAAGAGSGSGSAAAVDLSVLDKQFDKFGNELTAKDRFKVMAQAFHGYGAGLGKLEKRTKQAREQQRERKKSNDPAAQADKFSKIQQQIGSAFVVIDKKMKLTGPSEAAIKNAIRNAPPQPPPGMKKKF